MDKDTKARLAIKNIPVPSEDLITSKVRREIEINRRLSHKHVVTFYNFHFLPNKAVSFVMEFMVHGSLKRRLNELEAEQGDVTASPRVEDSEMLRMSHEILLGVRYLHNADVVHRDLRSANVMLTADDTCKIGDFGISKEVNVFALKSGKNYFMFVSAYSEVRTT